MKSFNEEFLSYVLIRSRVYVQKHTLIHNMDSFSTDQKRRYAIQFVCAIVIFGKMLLLLYLILWFRKHTDVDECTAGTSGCSQRCNNSIGSFTCSCNPGYALAPNGRTCNGQFKFLKRSSSCVNSVCVY